MNGKVFLDTNILVYAVEATVAVDGRPAIARRLVREPQACISTQVLGEFYSAVTSRRRETPLKHDEATAWVQFWKGLHVRNVTAAEVDLALEITGRHRINYYDALILATARLAGCDEVHSEDLSDVQDYGGVKVVNPFRR